MYFLEADNVNRKSRYRKYRNRIAGIMLKRTAVCMQYSA